MLVEQQFCIVSCPEFLAEGSAVANLLSPDRVLIGAEHTPKGDNSFKIVSSLFSSYVDESKILRVNTLSSETIKLAANAFLAQRISSINSLTPLCEMVGADILEVS